MLKQDRSRPAEYAVVLPRDCRSDAGASAMVSDLARSTDLDAQSRRITRANSAVSPTSIPCAFRTAFFTGSTNEPDALSGNTEVDHVEVPTVTSTY